MAANRGMRKDIMAQEQAQEQEQGREKNFLRKLKELEIGKKKVFWAAKVLEAVLLAIGIAGCFGRDRVYEYAVQEAQAVLGTYSEELGGISSAEAGGQTGDLAVFEGISLPAGVYRVALHYDSNTDLQNICTVTDEGRGVKALLTNGEHLYSGLDSTDFTMWVKEDLDEIAVHAAFNGVGSLVVKGLTISETNAMARIMIFLVLCAFLLFDVGYLTWLYDRKYTIDQKNKNVAFCLGIITILASVPLFVDTMLNSGDLTFHLLRVEGIKDALFAGAFPARIAPRWQQGYGYAASVFYGETLLYIQAFFRAIGFTVLTSYRMFLLLMNAATVLVSYYCFYRMFREKYAGVFCSMLYTLSIYRIYKTYGVGAYGEICAMLFLPVIVYGFYRVFTEDVKESSYRRSFIPLTIGFTGLVQSHMLSGELTGLFTILLCVILWKKVLRRETFTVLAKTVIYTCLLSAWFLVPFADYMITGDFQIQHVSGRTIQEMGLYLGQLLTVFPRAGGNIYYEETGMYQSHPAALGVSLLAVLAVWCYLRLSRKNGCLKKEEVGAARICTVFALLAMVMSLSAFPWTRIQFLNGITETLVSSLEFPHRFLTIATLMLTAVGGACAKWFLGSDKRELKTLFFAGTAGLVLISGVYLTNDLLFSTGFTRIYNPEGMGTGYVSSGEYLPYGTDTSLLTYKDPVPEENIVVEGYEKDGLRVDVNCVNTGDREGALELPLLFYKGYRAFDLETGEQIPVMDGNNHAVTAAVPAGYEGTLRVEFCSPWYWRAAEIISLASFVVIAGGVWGKRRREVLGTGKNGG